MDLIVIISQALLYICFSILIGSFVLLLVPNNYRPNLNIPKRLLFINAITLPIFALFPVLEIILFIAPRLGFFQSVKIVLTTYTVGSAWCFTLMGSILLAFLIAFSKSTEKWFFALIGAFLTIALMLTVAWSSHASSINQVIGITSDFLHLAAVSSWVGIVLIVGWCSVNQDNWLEFLSWFSIVAFSCFTVTALSGLFLMDVIVESYINSWIISYGQGLLLKHLFLLPLIFYAVVNGFLVRYKRSKDNRFNPIPRVRVEGFILLSIFILTAFFTQQSPPHGNYLTNEAISPLFRVFHDKVIDFGSTIDFVVNSTTVWFFFLSILLIGLIGLSVFKKVSIMMSFLFSCLFVISLYVMIMVTVVVR